MGSSKTNRRTAPLELDQVNGGSILTSGGGSILASVEARNEMARRGHSRDQRADCLQVCIALVVSREGMPLGYEVFDGNTTDVTTVKTIVGTMEARYGLAQRIWVMDRGMRSKSNVQWLQETGRRY